MNATHRMKTTASPLINRLTSSSGPRSSSSSSSRWGGKGPGTRVEITQTFERRITVSHVSKVVTLAAALLVFVGGVSLAAPPDPTKQISPSQGQATPQAAARLPDLISYNGAGYPWTIGVPYFSCVNWPLGKVLQIQVYVFNIGTAATTVPVKTHVKINGSNWDEPHTFTAGAGIAPQSGRVFVKASSALGPGTYTLWVKVDSDNAQAELNENNNEATATTTCN